MDLGLNVVIRKHMYPVDFTAHQLVSIPDCPGGVLVICKGFLIYKKPDHEDIYCQIPERRNLLESSASKPYITCHSTFQNEGQFFSLLASEYGDLYKVSLDFTEQAVHSMIC